MDKRTEDPRITLFPDLVQALQTAMEEWGWHIDNEDVPEFTRAERVLKRARKLLPTPTEGGTDDDAQ